MHNSTDGPPPAITKFQPVLLDGNQWFTLQKMADEKNPNRSPHLRQDATYLLENPMKGDYNCMGWSINDLRKIAIQDEDLKGFEDFCKIFTLP
jgi:hypothetical protein